MRNAEVDLKKTLLKLDDIIEYQIQFKDSKKFSSEDIMLISKAKGLKRRIGKMLKEF